MKTEYGKIEKVTIGAGGYHGAMFGVTIVLTFRGGGTSCVDFLGNWTTYPSHAEYPEAQFEAVPAETWAWLRSLMREAKAENLNQLVGKPVVAEFEILKMESWRIFTEVL